MVAVCMRVADPQPAATSATSAHALRHAHVAARNAHACRAFAAKSPVNTAQSHGSSYTTPYPVSCPVADFGGDQKDARPIKVARRNPLWKPILLRHGDHHRRAP